MYLLGLSTCTDCEIEFKAHIEKLVGAANWNKWKRQIELLLQHHDVHDVVCGDRECPSLLAEASSVVSQVILLRTAGSKKVDQKLNAMLLCVLWKVFQKVKCGLPTVEHLLT
ncbi:hypothetical protein NPIL_274861 [Nephila pilipes]|uniref:Uncharacterized protein n=1 Tax=Nephila pilipes TaxID=299642 RepID=A0A8X6PXH4_NEPPI|nr:hypothetical protein NPIL_274861 [Nephila pilipes]